jgi:hypothetical protein
MIDRVIELSLRNKFLVVIRNRGDRIKIEK